MGSSISQKLQIVVGDGLEVCSQFFANLRAADSILIHPYATADKFHSELFTLGVANKFR